MIRGVWVCLIILAGGLLSGMVPVVPAQSPIAFISGTVIDANSKEAIPDVNVIIVGTQTGRITDINGYYFFGPLESGSVVIEFSHVSYERISDTLRLLPGDTLTYNVQLVKRAILLDEVNITAPKSSSLWKGTGGRVLTRKDIERTAVRGLGDLVRLMSPGSTVVEVGPDLYIDLNKSQRRQTRRTAFRDLQQTNPLIILNGMRIGKSPLALNQIIKTEEIDEIVVLKGMEAGMYGHEGRDGVIIVETTQQPDVSGLSILEKFLYASAVLVVALLAYFYLL
ncbi:MAG: TonB-dependent receptor [Ignavibacteriae bacterium]|nr:TonB-dependent receptor [Ignavibacteriota bacterium]